MNPESAKELIYVGAAVALWMAYRVYLVVRKRMNEEKERKDEILDELESFEKEHGRKD